VQAVTIMKTQGAKVRGEPTTIAWQSWNVSVTLSGRRRLSDRLTALFKTCHARQYGGISFEIKRSMGGSIATFFLNRKYIISSFKMFLQARW